MLTWWSIKGISSVISSMNYWSHLFLLIVRCCKRTASMASTSFLSCVLVFLVLPYNILASQYSIIKNLPGFPGDLPFKLETGYIGVGELDEVQLFYYFIESEGSPEDDPLVLWLTGGPGCSSFTGLLYEIGPLTFDYKNSKGKLPKFLLNPYSWTKVASIIFLDQPVGTGFSYATIWQGYDMMSDTLAVDQTYSFLKKWLITHSKFLSNQLFVAGDSYAGKIVPIVVQEISYGIDIGLEPRVNLKGYAIGNPVTDEDKDLNSRIRFAYLKALISYELYKSVRRNCKGEYINVDPNNGLCKADLQNVTQCTERINWPQILEPKCTQHTPKPTPISWSGSLIDEHDDPMDFLLSPTYEASSTLWCRSRNFVYLYSWANDKAVQRALGIREGTVNQWVRCNKSLSYRKDVPSTVVYHRNLSKKGYQVLVYSGDHDMLIPYVGTEKWIKSLNLTIDYGWQPWFVDGQVAGYSVVYSQNDYHLTFATVKGGGHTAPEYRPKECLAMISRWFAEYLL